MSNDTYEQSVTFTQTAWTCASKVAIGGAVIVGLLFTLGIAIEQRENLYNVWLSLLWGVAFGGYFWGAVSFGAVAIAAFAWTCCVSSKLQEHGEEKAKEKLFVIGFLSVAALILANIAMNATYTDFYMLTIYQSIGVYVIRLPLIALIAGIAIAPFFFFAAVAEDHK